MQRLRRRLRGDLEHIVAKALRWRPTQRYASAREMADDVERHLDGHPVLARRGNRRYLLGRWLWRHRWALVLLSALSVASLLAVQVYVQSQELATSHRLLRILAGPEDDPLTDDRGLDRIFAGILDLDLTEEEKFLLLQTVRRLYTPEEKLFERVTELVEDKAAPMAAATASPEVAATWLDLGWIFFHGGHFDEAENVFALTSRLAESVHGDEGVELAPFLEAHARALADLERYAEGTALLERSLRLRERNAPLDRGAIFPLVSLGALLYSQGRFADSAFTLRRALEVLERTGDDARLRFDIYTGLAVALSEIDGRDPDREAERFARQALDLALGFHGSDHMESIQAYNNLAMVLGRAGQVEESIAVGFCDWWEDPVCCGDCSTATGCSHDGICDFDEGDECPDCNDLCGVGGGGLGWCGDGLCTAGRETCASCPRDCGACTPVTCDFDGYCDFNESCGTCSDCCTCNHDGICDLDEPGDCPDCL